MRGTEQALVSPILQMRKQGLRGIYGLSKPKPELLTTVPEILLYHLTKSSMCSVLNKLMN